MAEFEQKELKTNGRWTKVEHQKFLLGLQLYGKNWKKIEQLVGTRTGSQIRSHAQKFFLKVKKPMDDQSRCQQVQESPQIKDRLTVILNYTQNSQEFQSQYSYFMTKILEASLNYHRLNFWEQFIDLKIQASQQSCETQIKRKDSFVVFDLCNDSRQETALSCQPIIGQASQ